jgi:hypothetical protein
MSTSKLCAPCNLSGKQAESVKWCSDCEVFLCAGCSSYHKALPPLRHHQLVDINVFLSTDVDVLSNKCPCEKHQGRHSEFFCADDEVLCCHLCLLVDHVSCQNILALDIACKDAKQSLCFTESVLQLDNISDTLEKLSIDRQENKSALVKQAELLRQKIEKAKRKAIDQILATERSLINQVGHLESKSINDLEKDETLLKSVQQENEKQKEHAKLMVAHGSDKQTFLFVRKLVPYIRETGMKIEKTIQTFKTMSVGIDEPSDLSKLISSLGSTIKITTKPCNIPFKIFKQQQAQMISAYPGIAPMKSLTLKRKVNLITMDSKIKDIIVTGMTCTDNNKLLLSNCTFNTSILVLDDDAKYLKSIPSWHLPWDIAMIPGKNVAVATFSSQVQSFFDVDKMRLMKTKRTNEKLVYGGRGIIVTQSDMILLGLSSAISILNIEGEEYSSIRFPDINGFIDYLHMRDNGDIYLSNGEDVYCVKLDGTIVFKYSSENLKTPQKIATDQNGIVYIVGKDSNNVHRITSDGRFIDHILDNDLKQPQAICFNKNYTKCYVTSNNGKFLFLYDCN